MAWKIILSSAATKALDKLGREDEQRILRFLEQRVKPLSNPRSIGEALKGSLSDFWKYLVGDYRIIAHIDDGLIEILVVRIGNRREVYKRR